MNQNALLAILLLIAVSGITAPGHSEIVDSVVAVVNAEVITLSMVEDAMNAIWVDLQDVPGSRQEALQKLIDHKLELQEARRLGADLVVSKESVSRERARVASHFASPEEFSRALEQRGITYDDLEEFLREGIMIQEMIRRKFQLFVEVTDLEASEFFEQNREKFVVLESVHLNEIFFQLAPGADEATEETVKKRAQEVLEELKGGADFSRYTSAKEGGDYVAVDRGYISIDTLPDPAVAAAVSRLQVGESDLTKTPAGYLVVRLNDRRPTRQASFNEVKEEIKASLFRQRVDAEFNAWLTKERKLADIRIKMDFKDR